LRHLAYKFILVHTAIQESPSLFDKPNVGLMLPQESHGTSESSEASMCNKDMTSL